MSSKDFPRISYPPIHHLPGTDCQGRFDETQIYDSLEEALGSNWCSGFLLLVLTDLEGETGLQQWLRFAMRAASHVGLHPMIVE
jgi:hypothetical protein